MEQENTYIKVTGSCGQLRTLACARWLREVAGEAIGIQVTVTKPPPKGFFVGQAYRYSVTVIVFLKCVFLSQTLPLALTDTGIVTATDVHTNM